jgi:general secretion pathway protein D
MSEFKKTFTLHINMPNTNQRLKFVIHHFLFLFFVLFLISGCAQQDKYHVDPVQLRPPKKEAAPVQVSGDNAKNGAEATAASRFVTTPAPVEFASQPMEYPLAETSTLTGSPVDVNFHGLSLPAFINEVYGNILQLSFEIDPALQKKKDLVTLRTSEPQTPTELDDLSRQVLQNYGVGVVRQEELLRFTVDKGLGGEPSLLISGRTLPEVPATHRPIFQLVPLTVVRNIHVKGWLSQAFKGQSLTILEDPERNAVLLKGAPALVEQALAAIHILDQPYMRGRHSVRIEPLYVGAEELAKLLVDVLQSQGYSASLKPPMGSIIILPIRSINALLVFAAEKNILDHVKEWAESLDQPGRQTGEKKIFCYNVRNTSATELGAVLNMVLSKIPTSPQDTSKGIGKKSSTASILSRLVVDEARNSLVFQGDVTEWREVLALIKNMDKPARQVLIEVTIADVTLNEAMEMGVEWLMNGVNLGDWDGVAQTLGGLGVGGRGFSWTLDSGGETRAILNAFASDNRVKILSTPRIMVKSGMTAKIDVGTDVPIITSQQSSSELSTGGNTGILQTIEYRKTGILLAVKPVVYSGNRVDLEVSQEVSEVSSTKSSDIQSPSILTRRIETNLSLQDGGSVLLGGLISTNITTDTTGIPLLMDIPWLGKFFKVDSESERRTELMILIVPYVIDNHEDAKAVTQAMHDLMSMQ